MTKKATPQAEDPKPEKVKNIKDTPVTKKTTITIKKAKIKDDLFLEVDYDQTVDGEQQDSFSRACTHAIHPDLRTAFAMLKIHFILLCHQIPDKDAIRVDITDPKVPMLDDVIVRQFSVSGTGEKEGLILSGSRKVKGGKMLHLNSPFLRLCDNNSPYKHLDEVNQIISKISVEIEKYLFEEKYGEAKQASISFPAGADVDPEEEDD